MALLVLAQTGGTDRQTGMNTMYRHSPAPPPGICPPGAGLGALAVLPHWDLGLGGIGSTGMGPGALWFQLHGGEWDTLRGRAQ